MLKVLRLDEGCVSTFLPLRREPAFCNHDTFAPLPIRSRPEAHDEETGELASRKRRESQPSTEQLLEVFSLRAQQVRRNTRFDTRGHWALTARGESQDRPLIARNQLKVAERPCRLVQ